MFAELRPAIVLVILLTILTGLVYPLAVTGVAHVAFPHQADGSVVARGGAVIGSELIGQRFARPEYFHPRPSAAGSEGYDAMASGGSNLGPTSRQLVDRIRNAVATLGPENSGMPIPVDLVTTSGSGLDPDISPAAAAFQVSRIARARGLTPERLRALIDVHTSQRQFGILGEPRVNVLKLNLALDEQFPLPPRHG